MHLKFTLLLLLISVTLNAQMLSRVKVQMGTFVTISTLEQDKIHIEDGFNIIKEIDLSLSSYNKNATIYKLNRDKKTTLNAYSYEALVLSKNYYKKTDGYFDITIGSITKDLFSFAENERVPTLKELRSATVNINGLSFDDNEASIDEDIKIDLGGMGKGFAVDKVADYFKKMKIDKAIISASGDIRCLESCSIDVQDPFSDGVMLSFETLKSDMAISTSGNYNRYVLSTKNNHLINPKLKKSQNKFVSITLVGEGLSSDLDAYSTAASVMPHKKAYKFLDSLEVGYIVLQSDGVLKFSQNIKEYTKNLLMNDTFKK